MNEVSLTNNMDFNSETFPSSQTLVIDSEKLWFQNKYENCWI